MSSKFVTARWHRLVMVSYEIDPALLKPYLPVETELDTWNGESYVSLVAFRFLDTRVKGIAIPFHRDFEEINLRFYVRSKGPEGWRRGVVFVREVVPKRAIAAVARWLYNENYVACPTDSEIVDPTDTSDGSVEYRWHPGQAWMWVKGRFSGAPALPAPSSQEEFIAEHYWGYSKQRDGGTVEYRVEHPQWKVWSLAAPECSAGVVDFHGGEFREALSGMPRSAFVADGSDVIVRAGERIEDRLAG